MILPLQFELVGNSFLLSLPLVQSELFLTVVLNHPVVSLLPSLYQPNQQSTNEIAIDKVQIIVFSLLMSSRLLTCQFDFWHYSTMKLQLTAGLEVFDFVL